MLLNRLDKLSGITAIQLAHIDSVAALIAVVHVAELLFLLHDPLNFVIAFFETALKCFNFVANDVCQLLFADIS